VRPYLAHEHQDIRGQALTALRALKPADAAEEAVRIATTDDEHVELRRAAARMALELSPSVALQLTEHTDTAIASLAVASVREDEGAVARLTELLRSEHAAVREAAVKRLADLVERADLEAILKMYMEGHYYYSVVVWLDRFLYCPSPFLERYLDAS
jgi:HEAT repeat protein